MFNFLISNLSFYIVNYNQIEKLFFFKKTVFQFDCNNILKKSFSSLMEKLFLFNYFKILYSSFFVYTYKGNFKFIRNNLVLKFLIIHNFFLFSFSKYSYTCVNSFKLFLFRFLNISFEHYFSQFSFF